MWLKRKVDVAKIVDLVKDRIVIEAPECFKRIAVSDEDITNEINQSSCNIEKIIGKGKFNKNDYRYTTLLIYSCVRNIVLAHSNNPKDRVFANIYDVKYLNLLNKLR